MANPLTNDAQRLVEDRAMALLQRPEMDRVRAGVTMLWQSVATWQSRDQADRFDNMIEEYLFHHAMRAANSDPDHPQVAWFMVPPRHSAGRDVPGSRWAGDSPDFIYRTIPIAHGGHYTIHGQATCDEPPSVNWSLMADNTASPVTQRLLDSLDMDIAPDGSFTITVDASAAEGRRNHIQTLPGADFLMVRDALGDWQQQSPNHLAVTRLDPAAKPRSDEDCARHCAKIALEGLYYTYYCTQSGNGQPPNQVRPPMSAGAFGGMATQWGTKGNLDLGEDDAIIVRCNSAGAAFRNLTLTDAFHMSIEYWKRISSLNMQQMAADEDGDFTFVIAHRDPGIHNWLDTGGLRRTIFGQRWQAFPRDGSAGTPWMTTRLVRFDELERALPAGLVRISPELRAEQLAARQAGFNRRLSAW